MNNKEMERDVKLLEEDLNQLRREVRRNETVIPIFANEIGMWLEGKKDCIRKFETEDGPKPTIREDVDFIQKTLTMLLDHLSLEVQVDAKKEETFSLRNKNEG